MKEIVIISGKGGTGKTSFTASLVYLAGSDCIISDCDVDASDLHLLLNPVSVSSKDFFFGELAEIDKKACIACGECEVICRFQAIMPEGANYAVDPLSCEGCGYCIKICPTGAIKSYKRKVGQLLVSDVRTGTKMVHAKLDIGADNSGKLVAEVKSKSKEIAKMLKKEYVIVDGSPGIGCPVISSLSGADLVVFVTEPTLSAFHDLKRVTALVKKHRISSVCFINKADLNIEVNRDIVTYLDEIGIEFIGGIPYSSEIPKMIANAQIITESDNLYTSEIMNAWDIIKQKVKEVI